MGVCVVCVCVLYTWRVCCVLCAVHTMRVCPGLVAGCVDRHVEWPGRVRSWRNHSGLPTATRHPPPHPGLSAAAARGSITVRPLTCDPRCLVADPTHLAAMLILGAPLSLGRVAVTAQGHRGPPQRGHVKDPRPLLWLHRESWPQSQPCRDGPTWVSNLLEGAASPTQTEEAF